MAIGGILDVGQRERGLEMFKRSVTDNNVDRFISLLELADSDGDRARFQKMLVAEEDRYGQFELLAQRNEALDRCLATCQAKIERQTELMVEMGARGLDLMQAECLMINLVTIRDTLNRFRSK